MTRKRSAAASDNRLLAPSVWRQRVLLAIPVLGTLVLALLWAVIFARLSVEREQTMHESMASAAILSSALEHSTPSSRSIRSTRSPASSNTSTRRRRRTSTCPRVVQSDTLVQVALIDEHGMLIATSQDPHAKAIDLSDREHFKVHLHSNDDLLYISCPVHGRVSGIWTLQIRGA